MNEGISKISAYEMFVVLLPAILLMGFTGWLFGLNIEINNALDGVCWLCAVYLVGICISRVGSLLLQRVARKTGLIEWSSGYYVAERKDPKLQILQKDLEMYQSLTVAVCLAWIISIAALFQADTETAVRAAWAELVCVIILIILVPSYRRQSQHITNRINSLKLEKEK